LAATKTIAILDYSEAMRMFVATNHGYNFGPAHQQSFMQWEGVEGAARMTIGVNLDYPTGKPDTVEYATRTVQHDTWIPVPIGGNNFPAGFINSMSALQAYVDGTGPLPSSSFEDAYQTMELVEALYQSSGQGATPVSLKH
jgi:predicted dehydrogenase